MSDTRERLTAALALMEKQGMAKGQFIDDAGRRCIRGALGESGWGNPYAAPEDCFHKITAALTELGYGRFTEINDEEKIRYRSEKEFLVRRPAVMFNNAPETTMDDVRRVLTRAIELA